MAQRKETKKSKAIKVPDLQPKKDAKGGFIAMSPTGPKNPTGTGHQVTGPSRQK